MLMLSGTGPRPVRQALRGLFGLAIVAALAGPASARTIYVKASATGAGTGADWTNAYPSLQTALAAAVSGDQIWVAAGMYKPAGPNGGRAATFTLRNGVGLYGGFPGQPGQEGNFAVRNPAANVTTLSGDLNADDGPNFANNSENSYHVVTSSGTGTTAILDGFVVSCGNTSGNSMYPNGGGVYNVNGSPTFRDCRFSSNSSSNHGGGMYNESGSPSLTDCTFELNSAGMSVPSGSYYGGGGMYISSGNPTLTNCTFSHNSVSGYSGKGGAIYNNGSMTLTNCTFTDNSVSQDGGVGGAICNNMLVTGVVLNQCTFSGNTAGSAGGGMWNDSSSSLTLTNCTFNGNSAREFGGGVYNGARSNPRPTGCTFTGNSAYYGGGMYNSYNNNFTTINCVFSGNQAGIAGGAIRNYHSNPVFVNCTLSGNSAGSGGAMDNKQTGTTTLYNSILWNNGASAIVNDTTTTVVTYSCIEGGWTGVGNISTDPLFANSGAGDFRLRAGSPCIDAGSNAAVPSGVTTDLDGHARFADYVCAPDCPSAPAGSCGTAPIVDMGAYEFAPAPAVDLDHDGNVAAADFDRFVAAFGRGRCDASFNPEADFDADGVVTLVDYQLWLQQYRAAVGNPQAPAPLQVLGDFQHDYAIDEIDLQHLESCQTGPGVPFADPSCSDADLDGDLDVDLDDFGLFQRCATGEGGIDLACKY